MDRRAAALRRADFLSAPKFEKMHEDSCVTINHWKFALVILASVLAATDRSG